jgi:hypothetical protein
MKGVKKTKLNQNMRGMQQTFTMAKKWEKVWDEVKYCSDKCSNK